MKRTVLLLTVCFALKIGSAALAQEGGLILPDQPDDQLSLMLPSTPVDSEPQQLLQVFVGPSKLCCAGKTPIAGAYHLNGAMLIFDPAFDFIAGQTYTVQSHGEKAYLTEFVIAADDALPPPEVIAIYPSGSALPENTLRLYIQFSTPMMPHRADEFIRLLNADGVADTAAFMSFTQELWNADRTQLTLLMDPGRIKRGVAQNTELGPALLDGGAYVIVIDGGWPGAIGDQNTTRFEKPFTVSHPLRSLPSVDLWDIDAPQTASVAPLTITFDRPFDQQQVRSLITVRNTDGHPIRGTIVLTDHEQTWQFTPDTPWSEGDVQIVVDTKLEDVAGNNFRDLLDHIYAAETTAVDQAQITIDVTLNP
ncbi:MAG: Ig-like domain-containing protein [Pseudomonadota bacterium]